MQSQSENGGKNMPSKNSINTFSGLNALNLGGFTTNNQQTMPTSSTATSALAGATKLVKTSSSYASSLNKQH